MPADTQTEAIGIVFSGDDVYVSMPRRNRVPRPKDWSRDWWMPEHDAECPRCWHEVKRREIHVCIFNRRAG